LELLRGRAFLLAADRVVEDAVVAAEHQGGDEAQEFLGLGVQGPRPIGLPVQAEKALDLESGHGHHRLVEPAALFPPLLYARFEPDVRFHERLLAISGEYRSPDREVASGNRAVGGPCGFRVRS